MFDAILSLDLALSIFCGLFGLHMLRIAMARKTPAIFLAFIFLLLAIHAILLNVILNFDRPPLAASLLPVIPVLIGPLLLLFFQSARALDYRFQRLQALHAAPAVIVFLQMSSGVLIEWVDMIVIGSIFFYTIRLLWIARKGVAQFHRLGEQASAAFSWLVASIGYLFLSLAADVAILAEMSAGAPVDQSYGLMVSILFKLLTVSLMIWLALERTFFFDRIYAAGGQTRSANDDPERRARDQSLLERFEARLMVPGFFDEPPPSLKAMARRIEASPRQLSEAINDTFGESYSKQMNRRRIQCAKRLLTEHPSMPVTEVMFRSGFQTKSSFNKEFRAIVQMSPSAFRKQSPRQIE
jgi:AraC-like DNA-binding protein